MRKISTQDFIAKPSRALSLPLSNRLMSRSDSVSLFEAALKLSRWVWRSGKQSSKRRIRWKCLRRRGISRARTTNTIIMFKSRRRSSTNISKAHNLIYMRSIQSKSNFSHIYNSKKPSSSNSLALIPLINSAIRLGEERMLSVSSLLCFRAIKLLETSGNAIRDRVKQWCQICYIFFRPPNAVWACVCDVNALYLSSNRCVCVQCNKMLISDVSGVVYRIIDPP